MDEPFKMFVCTKMFVSYSRKLKNKSVFWLLNMFDYLIIKPEHV